MCERPVVAWTTLAAVGVLRFLRTVGFWRPEVTMTSFFGNTAFPPVIISWLRSHRRFDCLTVAPDCQTVVVGAADGNLHLLDIVTGEESACIPAHTGGVTCAEYSRDGALLATGGHDRLVSIRHASTHREICPLSGFQDRISDVAFSTDGRSLAACDGTQVNVWDTTTWKLTDKWPAEGTAFLGFTYTNDVLMGGGGISYRTQHRKLVGIAGENVKGMPVNNDGTIIGFAFYSNWTPAVFDVRRFHDRGFDRTRSLSRLGGNGLLAAAMSQ